MAALRASNPNVSTFEVDLASFTGSSQFTFSAGPFQCYLSTQMGTLPIHLSPRHLSSSIFSPYRQIASGAAGIEVQQAQDIIYWWVKVQSMNTSKGVIHTPHTTRTCGHNVSKDESLQTTHTGKRKHSWPREKLQKLQNEPKRLRKKLQRQQNEPKQKFQRQQDVLKRLREKLQRQQNEPQRLLSACLILKQTSIGLRHCLKRGLQN